jgi:glycine cleavage system protein P-like pyridoxal-binding family
MIKAYHDANGDTARKEFIVPDAAHGTNPATAVMCGYDIKEIPTGKDGDVDLEALRAAVGPQTAGIMLTNPSTLGVFDRKIQDIADIIHKAGGLLYYDGANLNAFDFAVMHQHLKQTTHGQFFHRKIADKTMLSHFGTTNTVQFEMIFGK